MTIAYRTSGNIGNTLAPSNTVTLPSTTVNDVNIIDIAQQWGTGLGAAPTLTLPSGWTVGFNAAGVAILWRVYQSGDPSSVTISSGNTAYWGGVAVAYSGCDTTNPVDICNPCLLVGQNVVPPAVARAPSANPNYNNAMAVLLALDSNDLGGAIMNPGGWTSRQSMTGGPSGLASEMPLTGGTNTGHFDVVIPHHPSSSGVSLGAQLILKPASAVAATLDTPRPIMVLCDERYLTSSGSSYAPTLAGVANGDLVVVMFSTEGVAVTPPGGYTAIGSSDDGALAYSHPWATSDSTTPSFSFGASGSIDINTFILRRAGVSVNNVTLDVSSTSVPGTGAVSCASLTPTTTVDLAVFYAGCKNSNSGTVSGLAPGTMTTDLSTSAEGPMNALLWQNGVASALGPFTATFAPSSGSAASAGEAFLFKVAPTPPPFTGLLVSKANVYAVLMPAMPCADPVLVQSNSASGEGTTASVALPNPAKKGNFLTAQLCCNDNSLPGVFTGAVDVNGGGWVCPPDMAEGAGGADVRVGYLPNCAAGSQTAVSTEANMNGWSITICEWSGIAPVTAPDVVVSAAGGFYNGGVPTSDSITIPQQTLAAAFEFVLATFSVVENSSAGGYNNSPAGPFSELYQQPNSSPVPANGNAAWMGYTTTASETLPAATFTAANSGYVVSYWAMIVTFRIVCPTKGYFVQVCS